MKLVNEKSCRKCGLLKPFIEFSGTSNTCKHCTVVRNRNYYRTLKGLVKGMYSKLNHNSRGRGHTLPSFTKKELIEWVYNQDINVLYKTWVNSNYAIDLKPSIDRLDSTAPYSLDNIRLVTWQENNHAAYAERKSGARITRQCKTALQINKKGELVNEYPSFANAARVNGFCRTNINRAADKGRLAHGFYWETGESKLAAIKTRRDKVCKAEYNKSRRN